jgi:hypothetical protein
MSPSKTMDSRPIRTEADYEAALAEIGRLFDAAPATPEGDRLDVLVTLMEAYETHHYPIRSRTQSRYWCNHTASPKSQRFTQWIGKKPDAVGKMGILMQSTVLPSEE